MTHRLVYETFVEKIPDGLQINHIDENKQNNRLDNLEVVTRSENVRYGTAQERRKSSYCKNHEFGEQCRKPCINETTGNIYPSISEAARKVNGSICAIQKACAKKRNSYRNEIWSYYERSQEL
ncbi:MAG: HNH endonuclease [Clostridiales bacterium]|nr:HNH endonuclease [Clostridiales bacterium]